MQNLANMILDNYSYLRLFVYIKHVNMCVCTAMVHNSILYNKAIPHIVYTISCCVLFCLIILCHNTMLY